MNQTLRRKNQFVATEDHAGGVKAENVGTSGSVPDSYQSYLEGLGGSYTDIYNETTSLIDKQNQETLAALDEQLAADRAYNENQYKILVNALGAAKKSGTALAKEQYDLLMSMSEEERERIYKAAEDQRAEEYRLADIERERGVVDANTSYAQNLAGYGKRAEELGRMGLSGSGYSDYLSAQSYATQRREIQAANAQSETVKREARYAENQAKLDADLSYSKNRYNAQSQYGKDMHDVETTYMAGLTDATSKKSTADHEAESAHRSGTVSANQAAADQKQNAEMSYRENLLDLEGKKAQHAEENRESNEKAYMTLFDAAKSGSYSEEEIRALAQRHGLSTEDIEELAGIAKSTEANVEKQNYLELLEAAGSGAYSVSEIEAKAKELGLTKAHLAEVIKAAQTGTGELTDAEKTKYADEIKSAVYSGSYTFEELESAYQNGLISDTLYSTYSDVLTNHIKNNTRTSDARVSVEGHVGNKGSNFEITANGETIKVQYNGNSVTDRNVLKAAAMLENGAVFGYGGKIYVKVDDIPHEVEARGSGGNGTNNEKDEHYKKLYALLFG